MKIDADTKPFTDAESYFADAKLYLDRNSVKEVLPLKITSNYPIKESQVELGKLAITEAKGEVENLLTNNASRSQPKTLKVDDYQTKGLVMPITNTHSSSSNNHSFKKNTWRIQGGI